MGQSHDRWLSTISQSPNAISMCFVPITSLLSGLPGTGFLSHAVNLYLRCKHLGALNLLHLSYSAVHLGVTSLYKTL